MHMKNGLFNGINVEDLAALERSTANPIPLWDRIMVDNTWVPCSTLLCVVSSYETILEVVAAVVPERQPEGTYRTAYYHWKGNEAVKDTAKGGCPLAHLNRHHLAVARRRYQGAAKFVLGTSALPGAIVNIGAEFRIVRAFRVPSKDGKFAHEKWQMLRVDETAVEKLNGKSRINPVKGLVLDYELQCQPPFEMAEHNGFNRKLLVDLGSFLRRKEPITQSTSTVLKYKLWRASSLGQFHEMFQQAEEERRTESVPPVTEVGVADMMRGHGQNVRPQNVRPQRDRDRNGLAARPLPVAEDTPPSGWAPNHSKSNHMLVD
jgi:hypothetical protein